MLTNTLLMVAFQQTHSGNLCFSIYRQHCLMPIWSFCNEYVLTWDRVGTCSSQPLHLKVYVPSFTVQRNVLSPIVGGFLGLNWCVSFLFCLLTHFLKSDLSLLLSFSLSTPVVAITPLMQQEKRWQQKMKDFLYFHKRVQISLFWWETRIKNSGQDSHGAADVFLSEGTLPVTPVSKHVL